MEHLLKSLKEGVSSFLGEESGQSLVEILVALSIGAILIGAASAGVVLVLQSSTSSQRQQSAAVLAQDYSEKVRSFAQSNWSDLYDLKKTSSTKYHLEASSSETIALEGKEGVIDNDIRGDLKGYWKLGEASSSIAHDSSPEDNNGDFINNPTRATSSNCQVGRCVDLNGIDQRVEVSDDSSLDFGDNDDFTLTGWLRRDSDGTKDAVVGKADDFDSSGTGYGVLVSSSTDKLKFRADDGTNAFSLESSSAVGSGDWHHFAVVWDEDSTSTTEIYIDGEGNGTQTGTLADVGSLSNAKKLVMGAESDNSTHFDGALDDIRIYSKALNSSQIDHIYNTAVFNRYFYVENVCRTDDANYDISGTTPCGAGTKEDPSTQLVTVVIEWGEKGKVEIENYVIRWDNETYTQTDWTGQSGVDGPFSDPTNDFSSSTSIVTSTGKIEVDLP